MMYNVNRKYHHIKFTMENAELCYIGTPVRTKELLIFVCQPHTSSQSAGSPSASVVHGIHAEGIHTQMRVPPSDRTV